MKTNKILFICLLVCFAFIFAVPVSAQNLLPKQISDIFGLLGPQGSGSAGFVQSRIQLGLVLALGAVVLIAVVYAIMAALKYIQSQGDAGKIEEAQKAIKAIFMGIGAMLIAIVGIVLVFVFFGANRPDPSLFQTCLSAPNSEGCADCIANGGDGSNCKTCEDAYKAFAKGTSGAADPSVFANFSGLCAEPIK